MNQAHLLLVGQGLAGTVLAARLLERGVQLTIIDSDPPVSASKVAAGLVNPIAGKRLARSWRVDELLPAAKAFYQIAEQTFKQRFYNEGPIIKLFGSIEEQNSWLAKSADPAYGSYLQEQIFPLPEGITNRFGAIAITGGGWLDLPLFLQLYRTHLKQSGCLFTEEFDFSKLELSAKAAMYNGIEYDAVVFCEGHRVTQNPYFDWLPVAPTKGEILDLEIPGLLVKEVLSKGAYLVPVSVDMYRVGATYDWREPNEQPTEAGKKELQEKVDDMVNIPYTISAHRAGIRPAVRDRRPLIGWHPEHPKLGIFNGMGSKGVLMAPFFAQQFAESITGNKTIDLEVSLMRYHSSYSKTRPVA